MEAFPQATRAAFLVPEKSLWIARLFRRFARPIRLNLCLRHSAGLTSSCVSRIITIFSLTTRTSETRSQSDFGQPSSGTFCAYIPAGSRALLALSMNHQKSPLSLLAVLGPTASGKSALAVWLAERFAGEIVACDSTQLYRGFDIGTAKPVLAERHGVPHHLIDVLSPEENATAGGYRQMATAALEELRLRERFPIFTAGTGLYLRALLEGLADVPQRSEEIRERLRAAALQNGPGHLHDVLRRLDPEAAGKISAADEQKLIRAIEICMLAKKPLSEVHRNGREALQGWRVLKIGLMPDRAALDQRI